MRYVGISISHISENLKKGNKRLIFDMVDLCIVNSWILYRGQKEMRLANFKIAISQAWMKLDIGAGGDAIHAITPADVRWASQPSADCRFDNLWTVWGFLKQDLLHY